MCTKCLQAQRSQVAVENIQSEMMGKDVIGNKQLERDIMEYLMIVAWDRAVYDRDITIAKIESNLSRMVTAAEQGKPNLLTFAVDLLTHQIPP